MEEKMRKTGIDLIGDVPWGAHFCLFYQSKQDLLDILLPYFKAGLENNEFCIWVPSEPLDEKEAQKAMRESVPDFDRYLKKGQMEIIPRTEWHLKQGSFNRQRVVNAWINKLNQALLKGFDGLRVTDNATCLEKRDWQNLTDYEEAMEKTIGQYQMMALCVYSLDKCEASEIIDVCRKHQSVLIRQNGTWRTMGCSKHKEMAETLRNKTRDMARVKELNCLYGISNLFEKSDISLEKIFEGVAKLIPAAWQYPEITCSKISFGGETFRSEDFKETVWKQVSDIIVHGKKAGTVEVFYLKEKPESGEGPFLAEERILIKGIAEHLGKVIERRKAETVVQKQKEFLNNVVDSLSHSFYVIDVNDYTIKIANAFAVSNKISVGSTCYAKSHNRKEPCEGIENLCPVEIVKKTKKPVVVEHLHYDKNGTVRNIEVHGYPIFGDGGNVVQMIEYCLDITDKKRAEKTLRESEARWRSTSENSPDIVMLVGVDASIQFINHTIAGLKRKEVVGTCVYDYIPDKYKSRVKECHERTLKTGKPGQYVTDYRTNEGETLHFEARVGPVRQSGKIVGIAISTRNITQRKKSEEALRESEKKYRSFFTNIPGMIYQAGADWLTDIVSNSEMVCGYSIDEFVSRKVNWLDLIHPDDKKRILEEWSKLLEKPTSIIQEYRIIAKDGDERWVSDHKVSLFKKDGSFMSINGIVYDMTKRNREKKALEDSEKRYRLLAESMFDVIWIADLALNFKYVSPSVTRLIGYRPEEVIAQNPELILGPRSFRAMIKLVEEMKSQEEIMAMSHTSSPTIEFELGCKDGSAVWVETGITFVRDAYGWPYQIVGIMRNITARKKAEERINKYTNKLTERNKQLRVETGKTQEAERKARQYAKELGVANLQLKRETERAQGTDRLKSQFLADMSHEIRTPITVIDGAVRLLEKESLSLEQKDLLAMIRGSDKQLLQLIDAVLDLARIEAGEAKVVKKEFLLKETVKNIISGFEFEARKRGLEIEMICPHHLPSMISTDEGKLTQILSNLISNALHFTDKGRVEVRLSKESDSSIRFSVEDTGIGIPEEKLAMIFSKFYQLNGTSRRERASVGLGLTIAKDLVDLLGGEIKVESKPEKGSIFCFSLPCIPPKERVVPDKNGNGTSGKTQERIKKGLNILVAEDDSPTYNIIRRFLQDCTITRAVDGEDVLKKIKEKSYDMVLMDIQMPKMDGLEATRRIREKDSDLPIIAVTARSFKADKEKCLAAGCNDYIAKPIEPQKLIDKINQYAVKRSSTRQNSPTK